MADQSILGDLAVVGWPDELDSLTSEMRGIANQVDGIAHQFRSDTFEGDWTGQAAEAFRQLLKDADGDLGKVIASYRSAANALSEFSGPLRGAVSRAENLAAELADAASRESAAQARLRDAQRRGWLAESALRSARATNDPVGQATAHRQFQAALNDENGANGSLQAALNDKASLWSQAHQNRSEFEAAIGACCSALAAASNLGLKNNPLSWLERQASNLDKAYHAIVQGLEPRLKEFLENLKQALNYLSLALTVVGVVALIVMALVPGLQEFIPVLLFVWAVAQTEVDGMELGVDTVRFADGDGTFQDIEFDTASLGLDAISVGELSAAEKVTVRVAFWKAGQGIAEGGGLKLANYGADKYAPIKAPWASRPQTHVYDVNANGVQVSHRHFVRSRSTRITRPVSLASY